MAFEKSKYNGGCVYLSVVWFGIVSICFHTCNITLAFTHSPTHSRRLARSVRSESGVIHVSSFSSALSSSVVLIIPLQSEGAEEVTSSHQLRDTECFDLRITWLLRASSFLRCISLPPQPSLLLSGMLHVSAALQSRPAQFHNFH